jgi:hypothetical protein
MKHLKVLAVLAIVSSVSAHAQYHNDIAPIKDARSDAKGLIKSFQLQNQNLDSGAPEYTKIYNELFVPSIKVESDKLEKSLDAINQALSKDYSLIMSLKGKPQTTALKATIKIAEERLASAAESMITEYYHKPIKSVVTLNNSFSKIVGKCLTVLCVNQVKEDFVKWIKLSSAINKKLDLETTSMDKVSSFSTFTKKALESNSNTALEVGNHLAVSLTKEEYQDILAAEQKLIDDARIKKEADEARIKAEQEQSGTAVGVKSGYGCENTSEYNSQVVICSQPYMIKDGQKITMQSSTFNNEKHRAVCSALGLATNKDMIAMAWSAPSNESDTFSMKSVVCLKPSPLTHQQRIKFDSKLLLEDGSTLLINPKYQFGESDLKGFSALNDYANETCKFLGFNNAVNENSWKYEYNTRGDFTALADALITKDNRLYIWTQITCK